MTSRAAFRIGLLKARFPAMLLFMGVLLLLTETGLDRMTEDINARLGSSARLDENARLEVEAIRFFETARNFASGKSDTSADDVDLALNLMWSRAVVLSQPDYRITPLRPQNDDDFITEFVAALPAFEDAVKGLRASDMASFEQVDRLHQRFAERISAFGLAAWNDRQARMTNAVDAGRFSVRRLRWIQAGFAIASVISMGYMLFELYHSRMLNGKLNDLVREKHAMLRTDYLTGVGNRLHFDEVLAQRFAADQRDFSIVYLDLDGFKAVNDRHGHAAGDVLLRHVAACLLEQSSGGDLVARFGGDEFAVLLTGDIDRALHFASACLESIATEVRHGETALMVFASAGICHREQLGSEDSGDMMRHWADLALYSAKGAGRNCVRIHAPDLSALSASLSENMDERRPKAGGPSNANRVPRLTARGGKRAGSAKALKS